jgi:ADP-heptose:LPS heptosyltransferase
MYVKHMKLYLKSDSLIGDLLMQTPAIRALKQFKPDAEIIYGYGATPSWQLLLNNPYIDKLVPMSEFDESTADKVFDMQCTFAFTWGVQSRKSMIEGFGALLGVEVVDKYYDCFLTPEELESAQTLSEELGEGKPLVIIARHSHSCTSNDPKIRKPNKCINNTVWVELANWLIKKKYMPVAVGSPKDLEDPKYEAWPGKKLYGHPLREVAALQRTALTISIDTGLRHMAAAVGGKLVTLSAAIPLGLIKCFPHEQQIIREFEINLNTICSRDIKEILKYIM